MNKVTHFTKYIICPTVELCRNKFCVILVYSHTRMKCGQMVSLHMNELVDKIIFLMVKNESELLYALFAFTPHKFNGHKADQDNLVLYSTVPQV